MTPISHWLWFHVAVVALMLAEFGLHRLFPDPHRKAVWATVLWTVAALALAAILLPLYGHAHATEYVASWAIEEALSVDNLFVFLLLFKTFTIPEDRQPKVLFWGVAGAIVMRGAFIAGGLSLLARFHWVEYVFGALLLAAAVKLLKPEDDSEGNEVSQPTWLRWLTRVHPVSPRTDTFSARETVGGKLVWMPTTLLLALIAVELTDVVFALDSIPAVLSITRIPFIAYTSNIMAVMGLRSLYVLLAAMLKSLRFMHYGLAALLAFAAVKMLAVHWIEIGPLASLGVIAVVLAITVGTSVAFRQKQA
ncbi:TerC/Alx family metal homeostasis membrane protein [Granulicella cerasi]|uniref:TerC/Alx family metal homeostasis membrane protein n=1 Tax=Granulicella cerasi TaxID=741063 RepID=A0ABW1Z6S3_9BACT|nr:TerC/Alx family metal homeostasis membrane protein [Granulicella cerasi]